MTIHHDKLAYGKLTSSAEDITEERIKEMLKKLNGEEEEEKPDPTKKKDENQ